jgi:predicted membrane protein
MFKEALTSHVAILLKANHTRFVKNVYIIWLWRRTIISSSAQFLVVRIRLFRSSGFSSRILQNARRKASY